MPLGIEGYSKILQYSVFKLQIGQHGKQVLYPLLFLKTSQVPPLWHIMHTDIHERKPCCRVCVKLHRKACTPCVHSIQQHPAPRQQARDIHPMAVQCWASVADAGQHCTVIGLISRVAVFNP